MALMRIGLVLGGGGIVGQAYHAAALAGLQEATGWDPRDAEIIVGTSAGAASAAELRAGLAAADMAARRDGSPFSDEAVRLLRSLGPPPQAAARQVKVDPGRVARALRRQVQRSLAMPGSVRPSVLASVAASPGRLSASWLRDLTSWLHGGDDWPERALWTCALDLDSGARVVFGREGARRAGLGEAVEASCAIPGVFAPVRIGRRLYIDGGAWSASNADVLAGAGLDLVIVLSPLTGAPSSLVARPDRWLRAACRWTLIAELAQVRASGTAVSIIEPDAADLPCLGSMTGGDALDEARCPSIVPQVRESTRARVETGRIPGLQRLALAAA
jgi:NTE family protein